MSASELLLAERCGWQVVADGETVSVLNFAGRRWEVGWVYGGATDALVTADEAYAVIVGCGVLVADLSCFGEEVFGGDTWAQTPVIHLLSSPEECWFFEGVYAVTAPDTVRLVADLAGEQAGVYELHLPMLTLTPKLVGR